MFLLQVKGVASQTKLAELHHHCSIVNIGSVVNVYNNYGLLKPSVL